LDAHFSTRAIDCRVAGSAVDQSHIIPAQAFDAIAAGCGGKGTLCLFCAVSIVGNAHVRISAVDYQRPIKVFTANDAPHFRKLSGFDTSFAFIRVTYPRFDSAGRALLNGYRRVWIINAIAAVYPAVFYFRYVSLEAISQPSSAFMKSNMKVIGVRVLSGKSGAVHGSGAWSDSGGVRKICR
jgi:hypothetical protein